MVSSSDKWYLEMESTPGGDAMKVAEVTTKNWGYVNLVAKAVAGFERTDSNFERRSTVGKMLSNSIKCHREIVHEMNSQPIQWTW